MELSVTTILDASPDRVWSEIQRTELLKFVSSPLVSFDPVDPSTLPETFEAGEDYRVELKLFGVIPIGKQWIRITHVRTEDTPGERLYQIRDDGAGDIVSTWDHVITLRETSDGKTAYTDEVEVDAGIFTFFVWVFANVFYRHRQARWRTLIGDDFEYSS